jgi:hypothetical protein
LETVLAPTAGDRVANTSVPANGAAIASAKPTRMPAMKFALNTTQIHPVERANNGRAARPFHSQNSQERDWVRNELWRAELLHRNGW